MESKRQAFDRLLLWSFLIIQAVLFTTGLTIVIRIWWLWRHGPAQWWELQAPFWGALQTIGVATASTGGLMTLVALVAPRALSAIGLGPRLEMAFNPTESSGCVHEWSRDLIMDGKVQTHKAIIIRFPVINHGSSAAESVEVVIEKMSVKRFGDRATTIPQFKPSRLRWADSYDVEKFDRLEHHRCETVVEPLIHSGSAHFIDFAFIFDPGSPYYQKVAPRTSSPRPLEKYWCIHPVYQWLPDHDESGILVPDEDSPKTFFVDLAIYCKNGHAKRQTLCIECEEQRAIEPGDLKRESVGLIGQDDRPIRIRFKEA